MNDAIKVSELINSGKNLIEVTIIDCRGSIPQEIGGRLYLSDENHLIGTVGGGKVEAAALEVARGLFSSTEETKLLTWNLKKDIGMTCGGEVTLFFKKLSGHYSMKLALFGAGHVVQSLCKVLSGLSIEVRVFDTRGEWIDQVVKAPNIQTFCVESLEDEVAKLSDDFYIASITMGHASDVPVLARALKRNFPFIGVIGSKSKRNTMEKELLNLGVSKEELSKLVCPIGLPFGKNTPEEIAISITAQLLTIRDTINC